jgi:hypothetical protein
MRRYFPNFCRTDALVLAMMVGFLVMFALRDAEEVLRDGLVPALAVVIYAVWRWHRGQRGS